MGLISGGTNNTLAAVGLNAGINAGLSQSYNSGGSVSDSAGSSWSQTDAMSAREWSAEQARIAFERQKELMGMEMDFNSKEAQIARDWNESMANTIYTRSAQNMKEAGINPILAANMGLSGASVGTGQTASIGGATAPMAQSFMDSASASQNYSKGSSWESGEAGLVTALRALSDMAKETIINVNSSLNLGELAKQYDTAIQNMEKNNPDDNMHDYRSKVYEGNKKQVGDNPLLKALNVGQLRAAGMDDLLKAYN